MSSLEPPFPLLVEEQRLGEVEEEEEEEEAVLLLQPVERKMYQVQCLHRILNFGKKLNK